MINLLDKIKEIRENLAEARRDSEIVDELLEQRMEDSTPDSLRELARRLRSMAEAKDHDWITKTFTFSTANELRCLADAYQQMAETPEFWSTGDFRTDGR